MQEPKPDIKVLIAAGASPRDAIRIALCETFADFAGRHGLSPPHVSNCVNGRDRHERIRAALAADLGVDREWLDELLDSVRRMMQGAA